MADKSVLGSYKFKPYQAAKEEEYMSSKQRAHFQGILMSWKYKLMEGVDSTVSYMKDITGNCADILDLAAEAVGCNLELRTRDRERKLMRKIESAIDDITNDDYGFCDECGSEIGIRRLEARPTATKCIDCKTFSEIRERQGQAA